MNSLKSRARNRGPLSEIIRGVASGCFSLAPCGMISIPASVSSKQAWGYRPLQPIPREISGLE